MKTLLLLCATLFASVSFANDLNIVCGDVQKFYVNMDLSAEFRDIYLNPKTLTNLEKNGFDNLYGGRNCGKDAFDSSEEYEVLLATQTHRPLVRDLLGPLGIVGAKIKLNGASKEDLKKGIVLTTVNGALADASGRITATFKSSRNFVGSRILIIRAR